MVELGARPGESSVTEEGPATQSAEAFAVRHYEAGEDRVTARFYAPTLSRRGDYQCRWEIEWPGETQRSFACGIDGVQALLLAMRAAHRDLVASEAYRLGALTYLSQSDLDLPPVWDSGPLCEAGRKPG